MLHPQLMMKAAHGYEFLISSFDDVFVDAQAEGFGELSSLDLSQHRALAMWFRDYCKKNQIKNLTKHEVRS